MVFALLVYRQELIGFREVLAQRLVIRITHPGRLRIREQFLATDHFLLILHRLQNPFAIELHLAINLLGFLGGEHGIFVKPVHKEFQTRRPPPFIALGQGCLAHAVQCQAHAQRREIHACQTDAPPGDGGGVTHHHPLDDVRARHLGAEQRGSQILKCLFGSFRRGHRIAIGSILSHLAVGIHRMPDELEMIFLDGLVHLRLHLVAEVRQDLQRDIVEIDRKGVAGLAVHGSPLDTEHVFFVHGDEHGTIQLIHHCVHAIRTRFHEQRRKQQARGFRIGDGGLECFRIDFLLALGEHSGFRFHRTRLGRRSRFFIPRLGGLGCAGFIGGRGGRLGFWLVRDGGFRFLGPAGFRVGYVRCFGGSLGIRRLIPLRGCRCCRIRWVGGTAWRQVDLDFARLYFHSRLFFRSAWLHFFRSGVPLVSGLDICRVRVIRGLGLLGRLGSGSGVIGRRRVRRPGFLGLISGWLEFLQGLHLSRQLVDHRLRGIPQLGKLHPCFFGRHFAPLDQFENIHALLEFQIQCQPGSLEAWLGDLFTLLPRLPHLLHLLPCHLDQIGLLLLPSRRIGLLLPRRIGFFTRQVALVPHGF